METKRPTTTTNDFEEVTEILNERLEEHDNNRKVVQDSLHKILNDLRSQIDEFETRISKELEENFTAEDNRLQSILDDLQMNPSDHRTLKRARAELLMAQSYKITRVEEQNSKFDLASLYKLQIEKRFTPETIEKRVPTDLQITKVDDGKILIQFSHLSSEEIKVLSQHDIHDQIKYKCLLSKRNKNGKETEEHSLDEIDEHFTFMPKSLDPETAFRIKVKMVIGDKEGEWSGETGEFTPKFEECCVWKECPDYVGENINYSVDERNAKVATKINDDYNYCTVIGNVSVPSNKVTSWGVKILNSKKSDGKFIFVGVAPSDIEQNNGYNFSKHGWYLYCYTLKLFSGPPHNFVGEAYISRKGIDWGKYVHNGDSVGVVMDTGKGELSFKLNEEDLGVAYKGIPLDKPLVPCVILECEGDSVELVF